MRAATGAETTALLAPSVRLQVSMRVKVLFFGMLKEIVGQVEEQVDLAPGAQLSTIFDHYALQFPR